MESHSTYHESAPESIQITESAPKNRFTALLERTGSYTKAKAIEGLEKMARTFEATFYQGKSDATIGSAGLRLHAAMTIAVDPRTIPLGTVVEISWPDGKKMIVLAADKCAAAMKKGAKPAFDLFLGKHWKRGGELKPPAAGRINGIKMRPVGFFTSEEMLQLQQSPELLPERLATFSSTISLQS